MTAGRFRKETRFVKEHARRDRKSVFREDRVSLWGKSRLHAKEMSACKTNTLKGPEIGQPGRESVYARTRAAVRQKENVNGCLRYSLCLKFMQNAYFGIPDTAGSVRDASRFARQFTNCINRPLSVPLPREFLFAKFRCFIRTRDGGIARATYAFPREECN